MKKRKTTRQANDGRSKQTEGNKPKPGASKKTTKAAGRPASRSRSTTQRMKGGRRAAASAR